MTCSAGWSLLVEFERAHAKLIRAENLQQILAVEHEFLVVIV